MAKKYRRVGTLGRLLRFFGISVFAILLSSRLTYTQDFRATNVLGKNDSSEQKLSDEGKTESQNTGSGNQNTTAQRTETEIETRSGVKVKTKVEDSGARKVEIEGRGIHFKFEEEDGVVKLKIEDENGEEVSDAAHVREREALEQELEDEDIDIASEDGHMVVEHNSVRARTNFPLSINPETKELIVTTPAGERTVAILPDEAIQNMLAQGFLTRIGSESVAPAISTTSATPASQVEISLHNGDVVYEVKGEKEQKFLGVIPVAIPRTILVSAQNGEVIGQSQSWLSALLNPFFF